MTIELTKPSLVERIKQLAANQAVPAEKVLETAVRKHVDQLEREAIHGETEDFWEMHDELVGKYEGEHVAIYQGKVVDHDRNASRREKRVRAHSSELPVLIAPVTPRPRRDLRWIGGKMEASP